MQTDRLYFGRETAGDQGMDTLLATAPTGAGSRTIREKEASGKRRTPLATLRPDWLEAAVI